MGSAFSSPAAGAEAAAAVEAAIEASKRKARAALERHFNKIIGGLVHTGQLRIAAQIAAAADAATPGEREGTLSIIVRAEIARTARTVAVEQAAARAAAQVAARAAAQAEAQAAASKIQNLWRSSAKLVDVRQAMSPTGVRGFHDQLGAQSVGPECLDIAMREAISHVRANNA